MKKVLKIVLIILLVFVLANIIFFAVGMKKMNRKSESLGEQTYEVQTTEVHVTYGDRDIFGELNMPVTDGDVPVVICSHGFGSTYEFPKRNVGTALAMSGYATYCYDFCGGSKKSKSSSDMTQMSVMTEKEDLLHVLDYIKNLEGIDPNRVYLYGESQGGFVSALVGAERPYDIAGLVLEYPALCVVDDAHKAYASLDEVPENPKLMMQTLGKIYYSDVWDLDVYKTIANYDGPVLLLHGDKDKIVNVSYSDEASRVYANCEYVVFEGQGHGFMGDSIAEARQLIYNFLEQK